MSRPESKRIGHGGSKSSPSSARAEQKASYAKFDVGSGVRTGVGENIDERSRSSHAEFHEPAIGRLDHEANMLGSLVRESSRPDTRSPFHELSLSKLPPFPRIGSFFGDGKLNAGRFAHQGFDSALADQHGTLAGLPISRGFHEILGIEVPKEDEAPSLGESDTEATRSASSAVTPDNISIPVGSAGSASDPLDPFHASSIRGESTFGHEERSYVVHDVTVAPSSNIEGAFRASLPSKSSGLAEVQKFARPNVSMESEHFNTIETPSFPWTSEGELPLAKSSQISKDSGVLPNSALGRGHVDTFTRMDLNGKGVGAIPFGYSEKGFSLRDPFATLRDGASPFTHRDESPALNDAISPSILGGATAGSSSNSALDMSRTNELLQMLIDEARKAKDPFLPLSNRETSFP